MYDVAFWKAAGNRALWTFAQTFLVLVGGNQTNLFDAGVVGWLVGALSAAVLSVLKSMALGMPETDVVDDRNG